MSVRQTISAGAATSTRAETSLAPGMSGSERTSTTTSLEGSGKGARSGWPLATAFSVLPMAAEAETRSCVAHCAAYARNVLQPHGALSARH